jgi:hypothetical protein
MKKTPIRCLKIKDEWINLILNGKKTWEIRTQNTLIRERIGLGNTKTKLVAGYVTIVDSIEMPIEQLKKYNDKHQANDFLDSYAKKSKTLWAWKLTNIEVEPKSIPYSYSTGSWCKITYHRSLFQ